MALERVRVELGDPQHVVAPLGTVRQRAIVHDDQSLARLDDDGSAGGVPLDLDQSQRVPIGRVHRLDGASQRVERDRHAGQEQADQGGEGIAVASATQ